MEREQRKSAEQRKSLEQRRSVEFRDIEFPLPPQTDESLCRDEYLKIILKRFERPCEVKRETIRKESIKFEAPLVTTAEGMTIMNMIKSQRKVAFEDHTLDFRPSLTFEEKQVLYKMCLDNFQRAAVEFLSVRLRKQIDTILHIWPGEIVEVPHRLFYWSLEHFERRQKVNQLYLGVLPKERNQDDLDCAKFCTDIREVKRLLEAIKLDFRHKSDLCKNSLLLLNDSDYENNSTWVTELESLRESMKELERNENASNLRSYSDGGLKLIADNERAENIMQIEMKYRVDWMHSIGEQHLMMLESKENAYQEQIDELQLKVQNDRTTFSFVDFVYQYQIDECRASISLWQEQLDSDLEKAELECNVTRNHWQKVKDDHKYLMEQVEMFKRRVQEVKELIEEEEREKLRQARKSSASSRKSSLSKKGVKVDKGGKGGGKKK